MNAEHITDENQADPGSDKASFHPMSPESVPVVNATPSSAVVAVMSRFKVANGMTGEVKSAFLHRPHVVEAVSGFLRMEVLSPLDDTDEIWLLTYWKDKASYEKWRVSKQFHDAHASMPKGLKLARGRTQIRFFNHLCS